MIGSRNAYLGVAGQERLRKARAEKAALREQAELEREQKEQAEVALRAARKRLAAANKQLSEAQQAAAEEEQARRAAAIALEAEPAYQFLSRALPLPPSWQLFNWEPPSDPASEAGDIHLFVDLSNVARLPKEDRAGPRPHTHKLHPAGLVSVLTEGCGGKTISSLQEANASFLGKKQSFCQDRLGTNETENWIMKDGFLQAGGSPRCTARRWVCGES